MKAPPPRVATATFLVGLESSSEQGLFGRPISVRIASGAGLASALRLLAVRVGAGLGLAVHVGERRGGRGRVLLVLVLFRLLLFLVASHLTLRHGGLLMS